MIITLRYPIESYDRMRAYTRYTREEVVDVLSEAQSVKEEIDKSLAEAGEFTRGIDIIRNRIPDNLAPLFKALNAHSNNEAVIQQSKTNEVYPLTVWRKEIAKERRNIERIKRAIPR